MKTNFSIPSTPSFQHLLIIAILSLSAISFTNHATLISTLFINEIHYDNAGADSNEFIELAGTAGLDLQGWALYLYNGSNGQVYDQYLFSNSLVLTDQSNGFGFTAISFTPIQNGPDGIALVDPLLNVIQYLSYEGAFYATNGVASGLLSIDIGVSETSTTLENHSLQLEGSGNNYGDFDWHVAQLNTRSSVNTNQSLVSTVTAPTEVSEPNDLSIVFLLIASFLLLNKREKKIPSPNILESHIYKME